jgi:hypothetical protein
MATAALPFASCRPSQQRRTWRQWARSRCVRIGAVLLLIVVVASISFVMPRRGLLQMKLSGARIELIHPLEHRPLARSLPFGWSQPARLFLGRNNQRLNWLGTDDDVGLVGIQDLEAQPRLLPLMRHFPKAKSLIISGTSTDALQDSLNSDTPLERVFINGHGTSVDLDGLQNLRTLKELKLSDVGSLKMSARTIQLLSLLERLDVIQSTLSRDAFLQIGGLTSFRGTVAFHRCEGLDASALRHLAGLKHLVRLELNFCTRIGDNEVRELMEYQQLTSLKLRGIQATSATLEQLERALPQCRIDLR